MFVDLREIITSQASMLEFDKVYEHMRKKREKGRKLENESESRKTRGFKCKGYGHVAKACSNQKVVDNDTEEEICCGYENNRNQKLEVAVSPSIKSAISNGEELSQEDKSLVAIQDLSVKPSHEEPMRQRFNVFLMMCKVNAKKCVVSIDGGCSTNVESDLLVSKVGFKVFKHPTPYTLRWIGECGGFKVKAQC